MDQKRKIFTTDYGGAGPFAILGEGIGDIGRALNGLHFANDGQVVTDRDFIKLRPEPQFNWGWFPFGSVTAATESGVGKVRVYPGYFSIGGRLTVAHLMDEEVIDVTATGHCILRVQKGSPTTDPTFYYSSSLSAPNSATFYEWMIFSADWDAETEQVTITHRGIGNKTVYATV